MWGPQRSDWVPWRAHRACPRGSAGCSGGWQSPWHPGVAQGAWRRTDEHDATREHLLMALADVDLFMIRASYSEQPEESR